MNSSLRKALIAAATGGAIAVASILVQHSEGIRYTPYRDPAGILTVCYGHTGNDIIRSKRYTQEECDDILKKDLAVAKRGVDRNIDVPLNTWQAAALIDFTFNSGEGNLAKSTMRRKFNAGDYVGGCKELTRWVKANVRGRLIALPGLVERRGIEKDICLNWKD